MSRQMRRNAPVEYFDIPAMYEHARQEGGTLPVNRPVQRYVDRISAREPLEIACSVIATAWLPLAHATVLPANGSRSWSNGKEPWWRMPEIRSMPPDAWREWAWVVREAAEPVYIRVPNPDAFYDPFAVIATGVYQAAANYALMREIPSRVTAQFSANWLANAYLALEAICDGKPAATAARVSWWCTLLRMSGPDATNGYEELAQQHVRMLKGDELPTSYPLSGSMLEPRSEWVDGIPEWAFIPGPGVPLWDIPTRRKFAERAFGEDYMIVYDRMVTRWAQSKGLMRRNGRWRR